MQLQQASRKNARIKMGIQGPSGSGKTYSALLLAYGLCGDWSRVAVIDTENHSADLYSHLGNYNVLQLSNPLSPEHYCEAINRCEQAGMQVIIIDSLSHEWDFLLDAHANMAGNSFANWGKITPRHNQFVQAILASSAHVIGTIRTKQDYVLTDKNGKMVPEKVGLKGIQRDGIEYDLTLVFDLDIKNLARASKDRTGLFSGQPEEKITTWTGAKIKEWCNVIVEASSDQIASRIGDCKSLGELLALYKSFPQYSDILRDQYESRKRQIIARNTARPELSNQQISQNGKH